MQYLLIIIVAVVLFWGWTKQKANTTEAPVADKGAQNYPYQTKFILTKNEYRFFNALKPMADAKSLIICPKIGLKDLFEVKALKEEKHGYLSRISQKHVDFVICDARLHPLYAIELDDKSHQAAKARVNDEFKNGLFAATNLPLYRIPAAADYTEDYLRKYIPNI